MAVMTRAEWVKIRDGNDVKQGRCKSVSIGKCLDAYHAARTCDDRIAKAKALLNAFAKYSSELDVKVSGEQQLAREIGGLYIKSVKDALDKYQELKDVTADAKKLRTDTLLKSKRMMEIFVPYAKSSHIDESIEFIRAVDKKMKKQDIYEKFIRQDAPREVNISATVREKLDALAKDQEYDKMNFDEARKAVCGMLNADVLPRFVQTKQFKELLQEMAGVDD